MAEKSAASSHGDCGGKTRLYRLLAIRFLQVAVIRIRRNTELTDKDEHCELYQSDLPCRTTDTHQVVELRFNGCHTSRVVSDGEGGGSC